LYRAETETLRVGLMHFLEIDLATLFILLPLVTASIGVLFLSAWMRNRETIALGHWTVGFFASAVGYAAISPLIISHDEYWLYVLGHGSATMAFGLVWTGARQFNGRSIPWFFLACGAIVWALVGFFPPNIAPDDIDDMALAAPLLDILPRHIAGHHLHRLAFFSPLAAAYSLNAALEFRRTARSSSLEAAKVLAALCTVAGAYFVVRSIVLWMHIEGVLEDVAREEIALTIVLLFAIMVGFGCIALAKERADIALRRAATRDPLTDAMNRREFMHRADALLAAARARGVPVSVLALDIDRFKAINDTHGHPGGDVVLMEFARIVMNCLRADDIFGRIGGEEFGAVIAGLSTDDTEEVAERIRSSFAGTPISVDGQPVHVTVSIGIAVAAAGDEGDLASLVKAADRALYEAKNAGRNRVQTWRGLADAA
jgi:diguanylate cyclase (GGDEF)-like protein